MDGARSGEHARLMDRVYRHQRYIYDLTRKYYLFGRDRTIRNLALRPGESLVEVGCGTARNLVAIARRFPETRLFGLDASAEMLKTAQRNLKNADLEGRVALTQAYAEDLNPRTFKTGVFDRALFSYSLSMIPDWRAALSAAAAAVSPDGVVHIVDFGDLAGLGRLGKSALSNWLKLFHVSPRAELLQTIEPLAGTMGALWVSPGRYAFSFSCRPKELVGLSPVMLQRSHRA